MVFIIEAQREMSGKALAKSGRDLASEGIKKALPGEKVEALFELKVKILVA